MVRTWWHKLFSQGQSGVQRGDRRARVRQRRMQKPWLEALEDRTLPSFIAPLVYDTAKRPLGLAVGDLRGNGRLDIVTANSPNFGSPATVSVLLGNGDRTFQPAVDFATGSNNTQFVALGQLRPGGPLDVISANPDFQSDSGTVSVLLGNGDGTFHPAVQYSAGPLAIPIAVAVGDFTGHGILDLVTVNPQNPFSSGSFSVLAGNGDGTFQTAVTHMLPLSPSSLNAPLAVGDFTGNGHLSIAVGTFGGVMVVLGNGDGTFQAPVLYAADPHSDVSSVLARDLTGTGRLDLVTSNFGTNTVSVLRGNGDGTFGSATNYPVGGSGPETVTAGRFRPGGPLDLVTANKFGDSVNVLPGAGDGTFGPPSQYAPGRSAPWAVAAADFGGRGMDDIVATNPNLEFVGVDEGTVSVLYNQGDGTFPPLDMIHFGQGNFSLATGDFRGIGVQDLVTTNEFAGTVNVFLGNGNGTFGAPQTFPAGLDPIQVVVGDFNGDGRLDLAVIGAGGSTTVRLLLGNGDGTFQAPREFPAGGLTWSIAAGHFHDPKVLDLVTLDNQQNRANVFLGNGDGTFQAPVSYPVGHDPLSVAVGDLRGDGITDLVVANAADNTVGVLLGNGNGTFGPAVNYPAGNFTRFVTVGSLRGNVPLDIVAVGLGSSNVTVLLGNGDGTFGAPTPVNAAVGATAAAIADFEGNGKPDLFVTDNATLTVSLLPGNGDGTFRPRVRYAVGNPPLALAVGDFNGDNLPDVAVLNDRTTFEDASISVLLNDGQWPSHPSPGPARARDHRGRAAPRGADPGVIQLLTPIREATPIKEITNQPPANALPKEAPLEAGAPLPAEGTVQKAMDAWFARSHRTQMAIPSAVWEVEELELGLGLAALPSP
jgi:hypothetical protein